MAFLQRLAPNGKTWHDYCRSVPPASSQGTLIGAWAECLYSSVVFEITNPDWSDMPEYQEDGAAGQVIMFCEQCGYESGLLQEAEGKMKEDVENSEGDPFAFLRQPCPNGRTWRGYCEVSSPTFDAEGYVNGAWGDCLTAAVIFEHQNPQWDRLPLYMEDGPAGQVCMFFEQCGHGGHMDALNRTEAASHEAVRCGGAIPVFERVYQALIGTQEAEHVNEDPPAMTGKKKALLVGCNYPGTGAELRGCINDVHNWKDMLVDLYGFDQQDMLILTDDQEDERLLPTLDNMRSGLRWLAEGAQPGDVLFWQYSGHGAQQNSKSQTEADGKDEVLCPTDYERSGFLVDDEIFDLVVTPLQSGVKLTIVLDCCHSGTAVDLPFVWNDSDGAWEEVGGTSYTAGDVQMFSGCEDSQTSADVTSGGVSGGAMTMSMVKAIKEDPEMQYPALLQRLHEILADGDYSQRPRLTSSQQFNPQEKNFSLCEGAVPNMNPVLGATGPPRLHPDRPTGFFSGLFGS